MSYEIVKGELGMGIGNPGNAVRGEPYTAGAQNGMDAQVKVYVDCDVSLVSFDYTFDNGSPFSSNVGLGVKLFDFEDAIIAESYVVLSRTKDLWQNYQKAISGPSCNYVIVRVAHQNSYPSEGKHAFIDNIHIR